MDTEGDGDVRHRLDLAMNGRRLALHMRWNQVADRAGMTYGNLHRIRTGQITITEFAAEGLERALRLQSGSIAKFLNGQTKVLSERSDDADLRDDLDYQEWIAGYRRLRAKGVSRDEAIDALTDAEQPGMQDADRMDHRRDAG